MMYKRLLLSLFLVPLTIVGNNTKNAHMQELEEKISQKELELTKLGDMIAQKDELLLDFDSNSQALLRLLINKRVKQLEEQNDGKSLSQEDTNKVAAEVRNEANTFLFMFYDTLQDRKSIKGMLMDGLFQKKENDKAAAGFESLKFYLIRQIFDQEIIMHLVKKYEECITEYRALMNELIDLQK